MSNDKKIGHHNFNFTPNANGGESVYVTTTFFDNGEVYYTQELTLMSYCNCATFHLQGSPLTPEMLRKFADELEQKLKTVKENGNEG